MLIGEQFPDLLVKVVPAVVVAVDVGEVFGDEGDAGGQLASEFGGLGSELGGLVGELLAHGPVRRMIDTWFQRVDQCTEQGKRAGSRGRDLSVPAEGCHRPEC